MRKRKEEETYQKKEFHDILIQWSNIGIIIGGVVFFGLAVAKVCLYIL